MTRTMKAGSEAAFQLQVEEILGSGAAARFCSRVLFGDGCWTWAGGVIGTGYGRFVVGRRTQYLVHRLAYTATVGDPGDQDVHHRCRNRLCVRPDHLEALTPNLHAAEHHPPQEQCQRGHDLATHAYRRKGTGSVVYCRACRREDYAALPPDELERRRAAGRERARRRYEHLRGRRA